MIIDADVHISPLTEYASNTNAEKLIGLMDEAGVDKAMCWVQRPYSRNRLDEILKYQYEAVKKYPDRLIGYGWVDPMLGVDVARDMIKRCLNDYGFYGIKFNGCQNEHFNDDPVLVEPLIEEIIKANSTLAFHTGADAPELTHPYRLMHIAKKFPELKILMVHMGGASFHDLSHAAIEVAKECPNVYLIGSGIRTYPIIKAVKTLGAGRVCFGSDTPFEWMKVEVARYNTMLEGLVTEEEKDKIMYKNIADVIGLKL